MDQISSKLISIMQDGIIDEGEQTQMESIIQTLDRLVKIIDEIKTRVTLK